MVKNDFKRRGGCQPLCCRKSDLLPWIDKVADKLPGWQAALMNTAGRITWVRFVLSAIPIYVLIAVKAPKWFIKAVNKLRHAYLWSGRKQAVAEGEVKLRGGHFSIARHKWLLKGTSQLLCFAELHKTQHGYWWTLPRPVHMPERESGSTLQNDTTTSMIVQAALMQSLKWAKHDYQYVVIKLYYHTLCLIFY